MWDISGQQVGYLFTMQVDLERLAAGYRHRPASSAGLARAKRAAEAAGVGLGDVAIDVGGGPGEHCAVWGRARAFGILVDPSHGMTQMGMRRPGVSAIRAQSQHLPIANGVARLVYFHLSIHYGDWRRAVEEARRVLGPNGECWIWTMGETHHRQSFLARWFPSVGDIDAARFPDPKRIVHFMKERWTRVETGQEVEPRVTRSGTWRSAVEARFVSTLQLVPEDEFRRGLAAYDEAHPDPEELVAYRLTFDWVRARK